jgi:hypothetical protein
MHEKRQQPFGASAFGQDKAESPGSPPSHKRIRHEDFPGNPVFYGPSHKYVPIAYRQMATPDEPIGNELIKAALDEIDKLI